MGLREPKCPDCGEIIPTTLKEICQWLSVWDPAAHRCTARQEREAAELAERAEREREFRENPPDERIRRIFDAVRLPSETPPGLKFIRHAEVSRNLIDAAAQHRRLWLAGTRPEKGLWVYGPTDQRKTLVMGALLFDVAHRTNRPTLFWNVSDLMAHIRRAAQGKENEYDSGAMAAVDLLGVDDLGTVKITERAWDELFHLVESAKSGWGQTARKQTLYVTSNETPEAMVLRLSPPDDPSGGERIVRRLRQICEPVEVGL